MKDETKPSETLSPREWPTLLTELRNAYVVRDAFFESKWFDSLPKCDERIERLWAEVDAKRSGRPRGESDGGERRLPDTKL